MQLRDGLIGAVGVLEANEGEEFARSIQLVRVDLLDEDGLQLAELRKNLGQVSLPVLDVGGVFDLGLVLLEALDDDVVEDLAHLSLGLGVVLVEQHLVIGICEHFQGSLNLTIGESFKEIICLSSGEHFKNSLLLKFTKQSKGGLEPLFWKLFLSFVQNLQGQLVIVFFKLFYSSLYLRFGELSMGIV